MPRVNDNGDLSSVLLKLKPRQRKGPVWEGPESNGPQGGVTFSMLSRFLCCRERFRLVVVEGLKPVERFSHLLEYGTMWHVCEESLAHGKPVKECLRDLDAHCAGLMCKYRLQQADVAKWHLVCHTQFPIYVDFWHRHKDVSSREPFLSEQEFCAPIDLPSGRRVFLRGKIDSADRVNDKDTAGIWVQENKTKGQVKESQVRRQMKMDLQTMIYVVAVEALLQSADAKLQRWAGPIRGVRYNVVRRPLSGGKGSIVQRKGKPARRLANGKIREAVPGEALSDFVDRVGANIARSPEESFFRWNVELMPTDLPRFKDKCLFPILENLCWWWDEVSGAGHQHTDVAPPANWIHPFGVRNILDEGGSTDLDEMILTGGSIGLRRVDNLFPELKGVANAASR